MYRKILWIYMSLAAVAILAPANASAKTLEDTAGTETVTVKTGAKIKAISEGISIFSGGDVNVRCNENFLTGEVVKNNGETIEETITDGQFASNLTSSGTNCETGLGPMTYTLPLTNGPLVVKTHWCIVSNAADGDNFRFFGRACGEAGEGTLTFIVDFHTIFGEVQCGYTHAGPISGDFATETTGHKAGTLSLSGEPEFKRESGSSTCSKTMKCQELKFTLYTDTAAGTGTNEWDDAASTADPVWISNLSLL